MKEMCGDFLVRLVWIRRRLRERESGGGDMAAD